MRRLTWICSLVAAMVGAKALASAAGITIATTGVFALAGKTSTINSTMNASPVTSLVWDMQFEQYYAGAKVRIDAYDVEQTKKMHLIVVDDNLTTFMHLHPMPAEDGTFQQHLVFPKVALYHIYADTAPHDAGQQVFRFDFVGGVPSDRLPARKISGGINSGTAHVSAGPYSVAFEIPSLQDQSEAMLSVHISKGGKPADDLRPYLGAAAHAVFIAASDLAYIHVHPTAEGATESHDMMSMSGMDNHDDAKAGSDLQLHVTPPHPGTYRLWLQFANAAGNVLVAPITLKVN